MTGGTDTTAAPAPPRSEAGWQVPAIAALLGCVGLLVPQSLPELGQPGGFPSPVVIGALGLPEELASYSITLIVAGVAATLIGVLLSRYWTWLLLAGAALGFGAAVLPHLVPPGATGINQLIGVAAAAGTPLLLLGVLATAQYVVSYGRPAAGAAVAGVGLLAGVLGTAILPPGGVDLTVPVLALTVAGLLGGIVAVAGSVTGVHRPVGLTTPPRILVCGSIAALLPLSTQVFVTLTGGRLAPYVAIGVVGAGVLLAALALTFLADSRAGGAVVVAAAVLAGVGVPILSAGYSVAAVMGTAWPLAVLGAGLGVGVARLRWGAWAAAIACGFLGGAVLLLVLGPAGVGPVLSSAVLACVLLVVAAAAVPLAVSAVAPLLGRHSMLVVGLGPLLAGLVMAVRELTLLGRFAGRFLDIGVVHGQADTTVAGLLLMTAAVGLAIVAVRGSRPLS